MSNRSYVISLVKQTFMHSWRISPQTFVNYVSNKQCSWTHIASRVQQTRRTSLDQGANWFGAPATNARRVSAANRIFNRTNPPIVAKIKDCKFIRMQNLHNFRTIGSVFFPTHVSDNHSQSLTHAYRKLIRSGTRHAACSRARVPRNHHPNQEDPSSVHDIWATIHMSSQQLAATDCFHCVTKVSYS